MHFITSFLFFACSEENTAPIVEVRLQGISESDTGPDIYSDDFVQPATISASITQLTAWAEIEDYYRDELEISSLLVNETTGEEITRFDFTAMYDEEEEYENNRNTETLSIDVDFYDETGEPYEDFEFRVKDVITFSIEASDGSFTTKESISVEVE